MTLLVDACRWLAGSTLGTTLRESDNLFSVIEALHVIGITAVAGAIAIVDMRILGVALRTVPLADLLPPLVRVAWLGFAVMLATGLLLFSAEAADLYVNVAFRLKLLLMAAAGLNQLYFHRFLAPRIAAAGPTPAPGAARGSAALSLTLWAAIVASGRAIAYV